MESEKVEYAWTVRGPFYGEIVRKLAVQRLFAQTSHVFLAETAAAFSVK